MRMRYWPTPTPTLEPRTALPSRGAVTAPYAPQRRSARFWPSSTDGNAVVVPRHQNIVEVELEKDAVILWREGGGLTRGLAGGPVLDQAGVAPCEELASGADRVIDGRVQGVAAISTQVAALWRRWLHKDEN